MDSPNDSKMQMGQQGLAVPVAIVAAGALIAAALYFTSGGTGTGTTPDNMNTASGSPDKAEPVTSSDHIMGSTNAKVVVVEYTDLECPFCKAFHITMKQIMNEYGSTGNVAWVIRNFPLEQLHPNAPKLASAAECVADLGGNDAYFKFLDSVFEQAPINTFFDFTKLDSTVSKLGIDTAKFESCYTADKFKQKITDEFNNAIASGGQGTPHNIVITKDGQAIPIPGAQPYATVKSVIDAALKN